MFTCPIARNKAAYAASLIADAIASDAPDYSAIRRPRLFMLQSEKITYRQNRAAKQIERFLSRHDMHQQVYRVQAIGRRIASQVSAETFARVTAGQKAYRQYHGIPDNIREIQVERR